MNGLIEQYYIVTGNGQKNFIINYNVAPVGVVSQRGNAYNEAPAVNTTETTFNLLRNGGSSSQTYGVFFSGY